MLDNQIHKLTTQIEELIAQTPEAQGVMPIARVVARTTQMPTG